MFAGHISNYDRYRLINLLASYGIREPLLSAFDDIPREMFVGKNYAHAAYEDRALPIDHGQTISQPSVVAATLSALSFKGQEKVLEIGTGSGYQTALLSKIAQEVYSVERIPALSSTAKSRLTKLNLKNIKFLVGDGTQGWEENAPYDTIILSAAFKKVPDALISQLKEGGKLVMPVGSQNWQSLSLFTKLDNELVLSKKLMAVKFVPLIGKSGWPDA